MYINRKIQIRYEALTCCRSCLSEMLRATLSRLKWTATGDMGPVGKRKVGKIPLKSMKALKKGHFRDFMAERPEYGSKEWVAKQYQDDYVNRPQLEGYLAQKQGSKYEVLETLNKFVRKDDKILNLSHDPSGAIWGLGQLTCTIYLVIFFLNDFSVATET